MSEKYTHVYEILIRTTPEKLWQALTDGEMTQQYFFGARIQSTFKVGAPFEYTNAEGVVMVDGEVLVYDPPKTLSITWQLGGNPSSSEVSKPRSKVTFVIEPQGNVCKLGLTHANLEVGSESAKLMVSGWAQVFSGLKTLLETGKPMMN